MGTLFSVVHPVGERDETSQINLGDWYSVEYDGILFLGEVVAVGPEHEYHYQVSVMEPGLIDGTRSQWWNQVSLMEPCLSDGTCWEQLEVAQSTR